MGHTRNWGSLRISRKTYEPVRPNCNVGCVSGFKKKTNTRRKPISMREQLRKSQLASCSKRKAAVSLPALSFLRETPDK